MSLDFSKVLGGSGDALKLRAERTKVLASNIANANTPGYQARDIDFAAALAQMQADGDSGLSLNEAGESEPRFRVPNHASLDGNTVELASEQAAFSQNASDFSTSLTFLNLKLRGLASAIRGE